VALAAVSLASAPVSSADSERFRRLQAVGVMCGFTAGAWLGAAEAPTKLVGAGISPVLISFGMVLGVFLARWSLPALVHGTRYVRADVAQAPHLVVWAVLGGCLWAVANTLTVYAIRDVGLSIAFPLWNTNSVLGIAWGVLFFNELRGTKAKRSASVVGGAFVMLAAASLVAAASAAQTTPAHAVRGVIAALTAGALWGTMYIPYRKAYLTGMSPLSFLTFFTVGELATMGTLALADTGSAGALWQELMRIRGSLFWLLAGGFVWVVGDLFQQYAAKYVGISRGIPLSNTNQLWGLLWGVLVFGELRAQPAGVYVAVVGGSLAMVLGAMGIAWATADGGEHQRWRDAAAREARRYGVDPEYTRARGMGGEPGARLPRSVVDFVVVAGATAAFVALASIATPPQLPIRWPWAAALAVAMLLLLGVSSVTLWRTTRFA